MLHAVSTLSVLVWPASTSSHKHGGSEGSSLVNESRRAVPPFACISSSGEEHHKFSS